MKTIRYLDRSSKKVCSEMVYGQTFLSLLYSKTNWLYPAGKALLPLLASFKFFSKLYGFFQKTPLSKRKVLPFIAKFQINIDEFQLPPTSFQSFNDFFTRKLKPEARPITPGDHIAIIPADGRYLFYQNITTKTPLAIKGASLGLAELLEDKNLADLYEGGSAVVARLAPVDYHRFHFPISCTPSNPKKIKGKLYSVNPVALEGKPDIFCKNARELTLLFSQEFGVVAYLEIGATFVGAIHQTFLPHTFQAKGGEKGFFSFGGSTLLLLFKKNSITLSQDLLDLSSGGLEVYANMGTPLGSV